MDQWCGGGQEARGERTNNIQGGVGPFPNRPFSEKRIITLLFIVCLVVSFVLTGRAFHSSYLFNCVNFIDMFLLIKSYVCKFHICANLVYLNV